MARQGRILVVDDNVVWRSEVVETLRREGYHAEPAASEKEALQKLDSALFHLAILDICLEDGNQDNTDGIDILRELKEQDLSEAVKIIMLSDHDTKELLRKTFRDYAVVDFLSKGEFNKRILLDEVHEAIAEKAEINLALDIRWQKVSGPEDAILNLEIDSTSVVPGSDLHRLVATELEDLLCRLFHEASSIIVRPTTPGQSATGVLAVQPFYSGTGGRGTVIVKFGDIQKIEREHTNFKTYIQHSLGGARSTVAHEQRRTPHLAGIVYSFIGVAGTHVDDFESFYHNQHTTTEDIKQVLNKLFLETCGNWYNNRSPLQPLDLSSDYLQLLNLTPEKLKQGSLALGHSVFGLNQDRLQFQALIANHTFTNPLERIFDRAQWTPTFICTTHGDFNSHNILLDDHGNSWLIDFLRTGQGHILRDVAELDTVVRFELLAEGEATLAERLSMEQALCGTNRFSQLDQLQASFSTDNEALARSFAVAIHLRKLAWNLLRRSTISTHEEMEEYFIALLYYALNMLRFTGLSIMQREHALLCASLLADTLNLN